MAILVHVLYVIVRSNPACGETVAARMAETSSAFDQASAQPRPAPKPTAEDQEEAGVEEELGGFIGGGQ
jgi:hypothetical protein